MKTSYLQLTKKVETKNTRTPDADSFKIFNSSKLFQFFFKSILHKIFQRLKKQKRKVLNFMKEAYSQSQNLTKKS